MPDRSEVNFCIMGAQEDVQSVKSALSDDFGRFNPYRVYAMEEVISQIPSFIYPEKGEVREAYRLRMQQKYQDLQSNSTSEGLYRFHYGPAMNPGDFPGMRMLDKEICYFTRTGSPPIQEFITISNFFTRVSFAMNFDSSWLTHAGTVYISRGAVWHSNYRIHHKDFHGYDIWLDENFDFRYITPYRKLGMLVPPSKLQSIDRTFIRVDPEDMKYLLPYFPNPDYENDRDPDDEFIPDDYIPKIYQPSEEEIRKYWDPKLADIIETERYHYYNSLKTKQDHGKITV